MLFRKVKFVGVCIVIVERRRCRELVFVWSYSGGEGFGSQRVREMV